MNETREILGYDPQEEADKVILQRLSGYWPLSAQDFIDMNEATKARAISPMQWVRETYPERFPRQAPDEE